MIYEWLWVPNQSLGSVHIGAKIDDYMEILKVMRDESVDSTGWDTYMLPDFDTYIDVENGNVVSITTYKEFIYKEKNLIGANIIKLGQLLEVKADEVGQPVDHEDGDIKTPYEYFDLGLQVWVSNNCVTSITCMSYEE